MENKINLGQSLGKFVSFVILFYRFKREETAKFIVIYPSLAFRKLLIDDIRCKEIGSAQVCYLTRMKHKNLQTLLR